MGKRGYSVIGSPRTKSKSQGDTTFAIGLLLRGKPRSKLGSVFTLELLTGLGVCQSVFTRDGVELLGLSFGLCVCSFSS